MPNLQHILSEIAAREPQILIVASMDTDLLMNRGNRGKLGICAKVTLRSKINPSSWGNPKVGILMLVQRRGVQVLSLEPVFLLNASDVLRRARG